MDEENVIKITDENSRAGTVITAGTVNRGHRWVPGYFVQVDSSNVQDDQLNAHDVTIAGDGQRDSGHYNYPRETRREIVETFHAARERGEVENIEAWAQSNYNITSKTLRNYEKEFESET